MEVTESNFMLPLPPLAQNISKAELINHFTEKVFQGSYGGLECEVLKIIKFLCQKKEYQKPILSSIDNEDIDKDNIDKSSLDDNEFATSCINTFDFLSTFLLKDNQNLEITSKLKKTNKATFELYLPSGKIWQFYVKSLFDGMMLHLEEQDNIGTTSLSLSEIEKKRKGYLSKTASNFYYNIRINLENRIRSARPTDLKAIEVFKKFLGETFNYDFNSSVITTLKDEFAADEDKVNSTFSKIYFVTILYPSPTEKNKDIVNHAFILERFYCPKEQCIKTRIYQSWVNQVTLLDDIEKRGYGENGEGAWNKEQLEEFITHFQKLYCAKKCRSTSEECFGYKDASEEAPRFEFTANQLVNEFRGFSVRYISREIHANETIENFVDFLISKELTPLAEL